ncbi:MAG: hypothetical protein WA061_05450 [Microgenomates group bacterium]
MEVPRGNNIAKIHLTLARYEMNVIPPLYTHIPAVNHRRVAEIFRDENALSAAQALENYLLAPLIDDGFTDHSARRLAQSHIIGIHGGSYRVVFEQNPLSFGAIAAVIGAHDWLNTRSGCLEQGDIRSHLESGLRNLREIVRTDPQSNHPKSIYHGLPIGDKFEAVRNVGSTAHQTLSLLAKA